MCLFLRGKHRAHDVPPLSTARLFAEVCWSFAGNGGYSGQLGTLTLSDPNVMEQPIVALSSRVLGQRAPMIISFKTAVATVGQRSPDGASKI